MSNFILVELLKKLSSENKIRTDFYLSDQKLSAYLRRLPETVEITRSEFFGVKIKNFGRFCEFGNQGKFQHRKCKARAS
jgi:hypothetical protein